MRIETAIQLIGQIIYKPGWRFEVTDHSARFENSVAVKITYPATNSDRSEAPGYATPIPPDGARASFTLGIGPECTEAWLYHAIGHFIMEIEEHEMREFLRIRPTYWAPFHPHHQDGIVRWAHETGTPVYVQTMCDQGFGLS